MIQAMCDCVFCKIVSGEIPSKRIYEDGEMLAFLDIAPKAPVHFLVIPKKHIPSLMDMSAEDSGLVGRIVFKAKELAREQGCAEGGARFVFNCREDAGQTVPHVHLHVLGGRVLDWPPG